MKKYITEEEIIKILGYKNLKSYKNSSNIEKKINKLLTKVITNVELDYKNKIEAIKKELIASINNFVK